jgi:hypothetical protein
MDPATQPYAFAAKIEKIWIMRVIDVPRDISKAIARQAGNNPKHVPVHGWIDGLPFQNTLVPRGAGNYRMHIHSRIWRKLKIDAGAAVEVTMYIDTEPREVVLPPDMAAALAATPRVLATFNLQTPALRCHIINYVEAAKHTSTRDKRINLILRRMQDRAARQRKRRANKKSPNGKKKDRKKTK